MKLYPISNILFAGLTFSVAVTRNADKFSVQVLAGKDLVKPLADGSYPKADVQIDGEDLWFASEELTFNFSDLIAQPGHDDHSMWLIVHSQPNEDRLWNLTLVPYYLNSQLTKEHPAAYAKRTSINVVGGILVPFKGATADQCAMWINVPAATSKLQATGFEVTPNTFKTGDDVRAAVLPNILIAAPAAASAPFDLTFTLTDSQGKPVGYDCTLYLEAINCQITENRVRTKGGVAKTTVSAISGASDVRVKAGFKFFSGKAQWQKTN
jgi:hypothetical protein